MPTDIEIAQNTPLRRITEVAAGLGIPDSSLQPYGHYKAKISLDYLSSLPPRESSRLVLVTAISPTPAGEGKTTAVVGLGDALNRIGKKTVICLREPSMGPVFGIKGGAAGGGHAQVVPMEDINLHFTGDFSAIGLAHNLLSASIDNHIHQGNALNIDPTRITWKRVVDMNDRALRRIVVGLGGHANGQPREDGFDIVVASEVMAIFCLCTSLMDLRERLGEIVFGYDRQGQPLRARQLQVHGAMAALLKDAIQPNLVQTLEHNPAIVHGGPFGNIAHGCNSIIATQAGLKLADYVVTEAGFGADLGAEKFLDIKCRHAGIWPDACVLVATIRALKYHGGIDVKALNTENLDALSAGIVNLERHVQNMRQHFGLPVVVALNRFTADTDAELALVGERMAALGVRVVLADHWAKGGEGAEELARAVVDLTENAPPAKGAGASQHGVSQEQGSASQQGSAQPPVTHPVASASGASQPATASQPTRAGYLYPSDMPIWDKIVTIAQRIYGAADVVAPPRVRKQIDTWQNEGYGHYPVCIAKTQSSFSTDATRRGAPSGHTLDIREVRLSAGAGFIVIVCGEVMTMPGLPKAPAAMNIDVTPEGRITGLF